MQGSFCARCGQMEREARRPVLYFLKELFRVLFELDGRAYRTLFYLLTKPGFLTREYFDGRRQRYTPPLRLFLVISISLFLLISVTSTLNSMATAINNDAEPAQQVVFGAEGEDGEASIEDFRELIDGIAQIVLPFLSEQANQNLQANLSAQVEANLTEILEDPQDFFVNSLEYITFFMLLMMPILALIQKILWVFTGHYYVEHLVLTVHNQSFLFLMMLLNFISGAPDRLGFSTLSAVVDFISLLAVIWMLVYLLISLKVYFQRGWFLTTLLFGITTVIYSAVLAVGILVFGILLVIFA